MIWNLRKGGGTEDQNEMSNIYQQPIVRVYGHINMCKYTRIYVYVCAGGQAGERVGGRAGERACVYIDI